MEKKSYSVTLFFEFRKDDSSQIKLCTTSNKRTINRLDHLQLANSSRVMNPDIQLIEEVWTDLFYLKSHSEKLNKSTLYLVPVNGKSRLIPLSNAALPTILGVDIRSSVRLKTSSFIDYPYHNVDQYQFYETLPT